MSIVNLPKRALLASVVSLVTLTLAGPDPAFAQAKTKVAAIYTVPFEQQ